MTDVNKLIIEAGTVVGSIFYSPIFGRLIYSKTIVSDEDEIDRDMIFFDKIGLERRFDRYGRYRYHSLNLSEEIMLWPSKESRSWGKFTSAMPVEVAEGEEQMPESIPVALRVSPSNVEIRRYGLNSAQWDVVDEMVEGGGKHVCGYHLSAVQNPHTEILNKTRNTDLIDFVADCIGLGGDLYVFNKGRQRIGLVGIIKKNI